MARTGARQLLCVGLLLTAAAVLVQHTCSARPLQQEVPAAAAEEGSAGGLLHAAAVQVHVDAGAAAFGNGAAPQDQGGDAAAGIAVPYENKRLSPGGPDPQHH